MDKKEKQKYVVGFLFRTLTENEPEVALISKLRPDWQKGKLNGLGGHIEETDESSLHAMIREFYEESGYQTCNKDWLEFLIMEYPTCVIEFFMTTNHNTATLISKTDEQVGWYKLSEIDNLPVVDNLKWILRMGLDPDLLCGRIISMK